jgi:hypothetical protein
LEADKGNRIRTFNYMAKGIAWEDWEEDMYPDQSTFIPRKDSPNQDLMTSSLCSPSPSCFPKSSNHDLSGLVLMSVATQGNPEESSCSQILTSWLSLSLLSKCLGKHLEHNGKQMTEEGMYWDNLLLVVLL